MKLIYLSCFFGVYPSFWSQSPIKKEYFLNCQTIPYRHRVAFGKVSLRMRWNWLRVYCNFCGPSMSSRRTFGKCFTQARVSWAVEMGADDPLWHSLSISPQELGHRRWRVQSQSFCSSVFMATINHSLVLLCSRGNLCVRHREALVDKPFPSSSTSNFIIQHCTGLFLPFYTRKNKKQKHDFIKGDTNASSYFPSSGEIGDSLPRQLFKWTQQVMAS